MTTLKCTVEELTAFDSIDCDCEIAVTYSVEAGDDGDYWTPPTGPTIDLEDWKFTAVMTYNAAGERVTPESFGFTVEEIKENLTEQVEAYIDAIDDEDVFEQAGQDEEGAREAYYEDKLERQRLGE